MPDQRSRAKRGSTGEAHARAWLEGHGYRFVAANWRCRSGELDLVMAHGDELVFVEVKTRTGVRSGRAAETITPAQQRRILASAEWFIAEHDAYRDTIWRCDIVAVTVDEHTGRTTIEHMENALLEA
jgi:putative endonuclease